MKRIEIEFFINRQGKIKSTIKGIKGPDCGRIARSLESGLGRVIETSPTNEYALGRENLCLTLRGDGDS